MISYYDDGYHAGACDRMLGYKSVIATTYPDHCLPGYAQGYRDGYNSQEQYKFTETSTTNSEEARNVLHS